MIILSVVLLVLAVITATLVATYSSELKNKQNQMETRKIYYSYSKRTNYIKDIDKTHRLLQIIFNNHIEQRVISRYHADCNDYNTDNIKKCDLVVFIIRDRIMTYGQRSELEYCRENNIRYAWCNANTEELFHYINNIYGNVFSKANFADKWNVTFVRTTKEGLTRHLKNIAGQLRLKINTELINTEPMAKLYEIDKSKYATKDYFTETVLNFKQSIKQWNAMGYKKSLLKEVVNYKTCYFGDTQWSDRVEVLVYKEKTIAIVDGTKHEITIADWQRAYDTKRVKVGQWNVGSKFGTINIGCKIGTYDEIAQILKTWSSL